MATNENNNSASVSSTFPVFGLAFCVLFVLKVAGLAGASWGLPHLSWLWVFAPLLVGTAFIILMLIFILLVAFIATR